jgi:membrane protein implicated in regulation of membrane protease activity
MKKYIAQLGLILLAFAMVAGALYLVPFIMGAFSSVSYKFVLVFIFLIIFSNLLAKIVYKYFEI